MNQRKFPEPDDEWHDADDGGSKFTNYNVNFANNVYKSRDLTIDGTDYSEITFSNLSKLNNYVYENENNSNYATDIRLLLPTGEEVTPLDLYGIQITTELTSELSETRENAPFLNRDKIIERIKVIYPFQDAPIGSSTGAGGDNYWGGADETRIFKAKKRLPNGELKETEVTPVEVAPIDINGDNSKGGYSFLMKLSNELVNENEGLNICMLHNNNKTKTAVVWMEVPQLNDRGIGGWIKTAFKGVLYVSRIIRDVAPRVGQIVGNIAGAVVSVGEKVESIAAPVVELAEVLSKRGANGVEIGEFIIDDPKYQLYMNSLNTRAITTYETTLYDRDCSWMNSNVFEPVPQTSGLEIN